MSDAAVFDIVALAEREVGCVGQIPCGASPNAVLSLGAAASCDRTDLSSNIRARSPAAPPLAIGRDPFVAASAQAMGARMPLAGGAGARSDTKRYLRPRTPRNWQAFRGSAGHAASRAAATRYGPVISLVAHCVADQVGKDDSVVVLLVSRGVHDRDGPPPCATSELQKTVALPDELATVSRAKLLEPSGVMGKPTAQLVTRRQLTRPVVETGALARDAAWPYVVNQDAVAVARVGVVVDPLDAHIDRHVLSS